MKELNKCAICGAKDLQNIYDVPDRHYGIKGKFKIDTCENCKVLVLNPMPSDEELMAFYPEEEYYSYHMDYEAKSSKAKELLKKIFLKNSSLNYIKNLPKGNLLDLGCGNGWIIYQFRKLGWNVFGVEPSTLGAKTATEIGKLNVFHGVLEGAKYPDKYFDVIRSNHSFEHIPNPNETMEELFRILKDDGKLIIGVPNTDSTTYKIFKQYWYYLGAPVHTYNYSPKNLQLLGNQHGFKVIKTLFNSREVGINGSIQIYLNRKNGKNSDEGSVVNNPILKAINSVVAQILNFFKQGDCMELIMQKELK